MNNEQALDTHNLIEVPPLRADMANSPLTDEQMAIINSSGNIKINAVAGSGKTTTIVEYAASRPKHSRILYLAFNRSVKLEAIRKFRDRDLHNVQIETAHSLAFRQIIRGSKYSVRAHGYKTHEIVDMLSLRGNGEKHTEYIIANHISRLITYFCNSDKQKVQDLNYLDIVYEPKARSFATSFYHVIVEGARRMLGLMDKAEIEIIHDFYLKKFQLSNLILPYDYILFDEGQDASPAMLDIFLKQKGTKIIVGDMHQQIYAWRHAVNSLAKSDFHALNLSNSFRFEQNIAQLASAVLDWKNYLQPSTKVVITGKGQCTNTTCKATIARTNLGLLLQAIKYINENCAVKHIYFEGNLNSYTYADDGASLYDVLHLYNYRHHRIKDRLVASMRNIFELEEYVDKTEDVQLAMMVEIVREYGNEIPRLLKQLKELHTGDEERGKAEMIFSTVHRAKGMEYDVVHLANDFVSEAKLEKLVPEHKDKEAPLNIAKWIEEINLLYVAITRVKNELHIPSKLLPRNFTTGKHIVIASDGQAAKTERGYLSAPGSYGAKKFSYTHLPEKSYSITRMREINKKAYMPWTPDQDDDLKRMNEQGSSVSAMAEHFGRSEGAIQSRLKRLRENTL